MWRKPFCAFLNPKYGDILPYLRDHYELQNFLADCARNPFVARAVMPCYAMSRRVVETAENRLGTDRCCRSVVSLGPSAAGR
jgi:hypothetical protein